MRVLFVSNYFPPEGNAPAVRLHEHARQWIADGREVEVLTSIPNFPEGRIYDGYENRLTYEVQDGIPVLRVPIHVAPNRGRFARMRLYGSFLRSAIRHAGRVRRRPDVVVATSPQLLTGLAGYWIARRFGVPFVLEVRDLWPDSVVAVGAMTRNSLVRGLEVLERFLYRNAAHIVVVTDAFVPRVLERGGRAGSVSVIKNGADLERLTRPTDPAVTAEVRRRHGWDDKFVAMYAGTIGMAHRADIMLDAAQLCPDPSIAWVVMGAGSERASLELRAAASNQPNFFLVARQPRDRALQYLASSDVAVIHLRDRPLFRTVVPSKLFEAMALGRPVVLGVRGESQTLVEEAGAGLAIPPEDAEALVASVVQLERDTDLYARMSRKGPRFLREAFDRRDLARRYWTVLEKVVDPDPCQTLDRSSSLYP